MRKEDVKRIEAFEMWMEQMERISWTEHKTNEEVLKTNEELLEEVCKGKDL